MVVHYELGCALAPDIEHGGVDHLREGLLWIIGDGFAERGFIIAPAPEMPLAPAEGDEVAVFAKLAIDPVMPLEVGGEGLEVFGLELGDYGDGEFSLR